MMGLEITPLYLKEVGVAEHTFVCVELDISITIMVDVVIN